MALGVPEKGDAVTGLRAGAAVADQTGRSGLTVAETMWLAAVPAAVLVLLAIVLLGPPLGRALTAPAARFFEPFQSEVRPEPVEQARFLLSLTAPLLLVAGVVALRRWRPGRTAVLAALAGAVEVAGLAFVVLCELQQKQHVLGPLYPPSGPTPIPIDYFSSATLLASGVATLAVVTALRTAGVHAAFERWTAAGRRRDVTAALLATVAIVVWLLHGIYTEHTVALAFREVRVHLEFTMDETFAVLGGRSPLVNYAAQYGSLWPYVFAAGMALLGTSVGVWIALALTTTGLGMLAIFAVLRRTAGSAVRGLLLFLPVLAASFFAIGGTLENRYTFGNYFGTFPLRYAGPSLLAWLVVRHLGGDRPRRAWPLFVGAGLVMLNNADAGMPALVATGAALLAAEGRELSWPRARRLAAEALGGLAGAYTLVSLLTLARAGALPDLSLLVRFAKLFGRAGYGMFPMPTIGLHDVVYLTFVAALAVSAVRMLDRSEDRVLTGMLAWSGIFGLGASAYFAGRSTPDNLIALFFPWSLTLALLALPAARSIRSAVWSRPPLAAVACVFGFAVMACSLAQTPTPWEQFKRLGQTAPAIFARPFGQDFIAQHTRRGEPVAIFVLLGHRLGLNVGVDDVLPYSNSIAMTTAEQYADAFAALRRAGGHKLFIRPGQTTDDMRVVLAAAGYAFVDEEREGLTELWSDSVRR